MGISLLKIGVILGFSWINICLILNRRLVRKWQKKWGKEDNKVKADKVGISQDQEDKVLVAVKEVLEVIREVLVVDNKAVIFLHQIKAATCSNLQIRALINNNHNNNNKSTHTKVCPQWTMGLNIMSLSKLSQYNSNKNHINLHLLSKWCEWHNKIIINYKFILMWIQNNTKVVSISLFIIHLRHQNNNKVIIVQHWVRLWEILIRRHEYSSKNSNIKVLIAN